jgi:putative drug exporter of the RND superfamily
VVGVWVVIVVLALPFAAKQTDHLTGGGFDVPGSQSERVNQALQDEFGSQADQISVLLKASPQASAADRAAAVDRVRREIATIDEVTLPPAAAVQGRAQLQRSGVALLPLRSGRSSDELIDSATTLREDLDPGSA